MRRFLNNIKNMETPEYLRSLAAVQDSHRILQSICDADYIEKKQSNKLGGDKSRKKQREEQEDLSQVNEQEAHLSVDERIILGKKRKRNVKFEELELDLHNFFTQNKRFQPDLAPKSNLFLNHLKERDYSREQVFAFVANFLSEVVHLSPDEVQKELKKVIKMATSLVKVDFQISLEIYSRIMFWI